MRYPVFLINLDRQPERLRFMLAQLGALGITPIRVAAVNGRDPAEQARASVAAYAQLTPGEIGCFESHRRLWQKMVDETIPAAVVLEDDVIVASDFAQIDPLAAGLPAVDLVKIDAGIRNPSHYGTRLYPLGSGRGLRRLLGTEFSTGGYFITLSGAKKLLARTQDYFVPVDRFMFDQSSRSFWTLTVFKLCPAAATQRRMTDGALGAEIEDSISTHRIAGSEQAAGQGGWKRFAMRLRRLRDLDIRAIRERRGPRQLARFARSEPVEEVFIPFESPDLHHVEAADRQSGAAS